VSTTGPARLGVDVGGTFTDLVVADDAGVRVAKVPSTPHDQAEGIHDGLARLGAAPADLARFAHGTTVATNTVLERDGARVVLVTTAGFRDLLEIGRQDRPSLYDLEARRPAPLVRGGDVVEVAERLAADGTVLTPLTDAEVDRVADAVSELSPEAVAISLLFCFVDDRHERRLAEALTGRLGPDVPVCPSSDVLPTFREYERTSTTALNATVAPRMDRYLTSLERRLRQGGLTAAVEVMRSGGGTFTADVAARYPVNTLLSGPAAGAWGTAALGAAVGATELLAFDMGGTSTDVTLVTGGRPRTTAEGAIDGLPFAVTTTDIHTVGSGGGSIAWRDAGGALRVGPRSAGAVPGPACYGQGGEEPTVTDADVVLGRLPASTALGGHLELRPELAEAAVGRLAEQLGLGLVEAAEGIVRVVEAQMVKAVRVVSVEQGHDPRDFTLVPFGGAGPLHQAAIARELGCASVLVPPNPGVLSALGLLSAPIAVDLVRTRLAPLDAIDPDELDRAWSRLERDARDVLAEQDVTPETVERQADLRYRGQSFELTVAGTTDLGALAERFHDAHAGRYGYDQRDEAVELVNVRVRAAGTAPEVPLERVASGRGADAARIATQDLVVDGETRPAAVLDRARLGAGDTVDGPAVVVGLDSTVVVAPRQRGRVDELGCLWLSDREEPS
jgi:N-methylhydantoinase A